MPNTAELPGHFDRLTNVFEDVWLIHVSRPPHHGQPLDVGILVAASGVQGDWHLFTDAAGNELYVQLPEKVVEQGVGTKAFNVHLPWQPFTA